MKVRKAMWTAGLGWVLAWPLVASAQIVPGSEQIVPGSVQVVPGSDRPVSPGESISDGYGPGPIDSAPYASPNLMGQRFWVQAEGLLFWSKGMKIPPLLTTGPTDTLPDTQPGTIDASGTQTLIGKSIGFGPSGGARFTVGGWLLPDAPLGVEVSYFFLASNTATHGATANGQIGSMALAIPYVDATTGGDTAVSIASPLGAGTTGSATLTATTRLQGWEATAGTDFGNFWGVRTTALIGYRYLNLDESLSYVTTSRNLDPAMPGFTQSQDRFATRNEFHGGQVGLRGELGYGTLSVTASGKLALGYLYEKTSTSGSLGTNNFNGFGSLQSFNGGYFTAPSNIGSLTRNRIAVVPEAQIALNYQPTSWLRLTLGYQFLYINTVARPGNAIDRTINPTQNPILNGGDLTQTLVGPGRPQALIGQSDFWAQGLTGGVEFKF